MAIKKAILKCDKGYVTISDIKQILEDEEEVIVLSKDSNGYFGVIKKTDGGEVEIASFSAYYVSTVYESIDELIEAENDLEIWVCDSIKEMLKVIQDEM